jgi:predicted nucleotidyltransferase
LARSHAEKRPESDVDLMITFRSGARPGLEFFGLEDELKSLLGCDVDIVTRRSIEAGPNPIRRRSILESAREIYCGAELRLGGGASARPGVPEQFR